METWTRTRLGVAVERASVGNSAIAMGSTTWMLALRPSLNTHCLYPFAAFAPLRFSRSSSRRFSLSTAAATLAGPVQRHIRWGESARGRSRALGALSLSLALSNTSRLAEDADGHREDESQQQRHPNSELLVDRHVLQTAKQSFLLKAPPSICLLRR